jgi:hypothetical protein
MNIRDGVLHVAPHTNFVLDWHHRTSAFRLKNAFVSHQQLLVGNGGTGFLPGSLGFFKRFGEKLTLLFKRNELLLELSLLDFEIRFCPLDFTADILGLLHEINFVIFDLVDFFL